MYRSTRLPAFGEQSLRYKKIKNKIKKSKEYQFWTVFGIFCLIMCLNFISLSMKYKSWKEKYFKLRMHLLNYCPFLSPVTKSLRLCVKLHIFCFSYVVSSKPWEWKGATQKSWERTGAPSSRIWQIQGMLTTCCTKKGFLRTAYDRTWRCVSKNVLYYRCGLFSCALT